MQIDRELIRNARTFIDGATVHAIGAWILIYETLPPDSPKSGKVAQLLRDFVSTMRQRQFLRKQIDAQREKLDHLNRTSMSINQKLIGI